MKPIEVAYKKSLKILNLGLNPNQFSSTDIAVQVGHPAAE